MKQTILLFGRSLLFAEFNPYNLWTSNHPPGGFLASLKSHCLVLRNLVGKRMV
jgi:hypothetical protein